MMPWMKTLFRFVFVAAATAAVSGCFSRPHVFYHAGDEAPPDFLAGSVAILLTNSSGYSAHLSATAPMQSGEMRHLAGDLLQREGRLVFQPASAVKGNRVRTEGGMFFIWNENSHNGFVLSDPLQGYAALSPSRVPTNVVWNTSGAIEEPANGHPCRRVEATVQNADGSSNRFMVWWAEDAKHFPVKIQSASGGTQTAVDFSDVRLEMPAEQLFSPPDGFTLYANSVALMNELIIRQTSLAKPEDVPLAAERPTGGQINNWRTPPAQ
jgi:hypothetical protein